MTEQEARAWVPREERRISPTPIQIPPHPESGDLPPCEAGIKTDTPCHRAATTHYGYIYYCDEHMAWAFAGEEHDEASTAIWHCKRFLWKAQVEGIDRLEYHLGQALIECEKDLKKAEKELEEAETELDSLCTRYEEQQANDAVYMALVDAYNRCIEERRRCEDLLKLHEKWANRRIGGVVEPEG